MLSPPRRVPSFLECFSRFESTASHPGTVPNLPVHFQNLEVQGLPPQQGQLQLLELLQGSREVPPALGGPGALVPLGRLLCPVQVLGGAADSSHCATLAGVSPKHLLAHASSSATMEKIEQLEPQT